MSFCAENVCERKSSSQWLLGTKNKRQPAGGTKSLGTNIIWIHLWGPKVHNWSSSIHIIFSWFLNSSNLQELHFFPN